MRMCVNYVNWISELIKVHCTYEINRFIDLCFVIECSLNQMLINKPIIDA